MEDNYNRANRLPELIEYQTHAIVSKVLLKKKTGNVTLFAIDKGEMISEHTTPFDAMVLCLEGKLEIKIGKERHLLVSEDIIIMPEKIPWFLNDNLNSIFKRHRTECEKILDD